MGLTDRAKCTDATVGINEAAATEAGLSRLIEMSIQQSISANLNWTKP
jgi:hypothetical protein